MAKLGEKPGAPAESKAAAKLPDPKDKIEVQNLLHRAMLAADDGRSAEEREYLEKAIQIDRDSAPVLRQLGELELAAQDYPKAATYLKRALELRPEDSTAGFEAGEALNKVGDYAAARDALELSLKQAPTQSAARVLLGHIYLHLKDAGNAEDQFEAALLLDSNNKEGQVGLAEAQMANGDIAAALRSLETLTKSYPDDPAVWHDLAQAYRGLHRDDDDARAERKASSLEKK
jgi:predicted Zn-dependent protease